MKKVAGTLLLSAALVALTAAPASAQGELGFGYANQYWNGCCSNGFMFDYSRPVHTAPTTQSRIFGDFSFTRFSGEESDTGIVGGIRETFMTDRRVQVFVQASGGIMHWSEEQPFNDSGNDGLIGGGAGLVFGLNDRFSVRVQWDFWGARSDGDWDSIRRFAIGGVVKLGDK